MIYARLNLGISNEPIYFDEIKLILFRVIVKLGLLSSGYLAQQNYKDELQPAEKIVHLAVSVTNANGPHWPYIITMTTLYFTLKQVLRAELECLIALICHSIVTGSQDAELSRFRICNTIDFILMGN